MGREVKRVHIDFDWYEKTLQKSDYSDSYHCDTWVGYIMDEIECPLCDGTGKNIKGKECPECYGEGKTNPRIEPPTGYDFNKTSGYQIWQNVSEEEVLLGMKLRYPIAFEFLINMRNLYIAIQILKTQRDNPEKKIVVILGSSHVENVTKLLGGN